MEKEYYKLTAPQKSIWLTEQYYQNTNVNNVCGTFYSSEKLDFELLQQALNIFLKNNDSFKIKLELINDEIKQYFSNIDNIHFEIVDIKNKTEQTALEERIASEVFTMLDSFLFKIVLFRYPNQTGGFVINSHHIISDSWTNGLVANEVALIYSKIRNNEAYSKDIDLSYKTYIHSELDYMNSSKFEKDKEYWNDLFSTVPEVATIPSVKNHTNNQDNLKAGRLLLNIDEKLLEDLKSYCEKNKVSLYNFFMTVFALYLGRVSNLDEFVIGTPILNRTNFKEKHTTGMFINTLPLKINLLHDKTFLDNLKDIALNTMSLLRHQKYSFQYLIEDLRKKDANLPKLYNVLYSYQITKMNENMESLNHKTSWTFNKTISDDLDIHMFEWNENNSIQIAYDYKLNKYDEQDILDLHARILHIIKQVISNENILLKEIEIVTPEEKHKILYEFNNTKVDYPKDKTIVDLFEEQVEKTPDNIAVVFENQQLTYRELNEKANQLARYLIDNDVHIGDFVGIMLPRCLEMIIALLGILKSGAAYIPIDPNYPTDRIKYILDNSNVKLLLVSSSTCSIINNASILNLDSLLKKTVYTPKTNLKIDIKPSNLAYIIYTSGSTGNPKGVMISHQNVNNFLMGTTKIIDFSPFKTILSITTISFDIFGLEIWGALTNGLKLVIANEKEQNSCEAIDNLCAKHHIQMIQTTPSRFNDFLLDREHISFFKNLTDIMIGGESLNLKIVEKLKAITSANIYNMYGPTETTIWSTIKKIDSLNSISIGFPIANTQCYVLDKNKKLLPPYTLGNLYIGGDGVSSGYLNQPELTKSVFANSDFSKELLYNTKDLAYYDKNGELFHLGRSDFQIKLRGYRIELGEIENKILSFKGITNAIVTNIDNKYLVSYYLSNNNIDINSLKAFLAKNLPLYMIPISFKRLNEFPYTPNGKIDRKKLSLIKLSVPTQNIEPRNEIDTFIIKLLVSSLDVKDINITDTFFAIGGDSLTAINVSSQISNKYNINFSVRDIFEYPIIQDLSDHISALVENDNKNVMKKAEKMAFYPLSSAQKRIYYASNLDNNSTLYNIAGGIIIDKVLDVNKLEKYFNQLIDRHEALRTHFEIKNNDVVQVINDKIDFSLKLDVANTDNLNDIYTNFVRTFDLSKAPLFRTKLVQLKDNRMLLLLDMHHIISDGTSLGILLQELCDLYNDATLPEKQVDYKDFTLWEKEQFKTDEFKKSKEYWVNQFKDEIPLLNMPTNYPRPSVQSFAGSNYHTALSKEVFDKISKVSKNLNITPYMLMLSAYYILLSKYTSQDDIVIGSPIVGRELPELSNMLGMFVNTLALRNKVDSSLSFKDFSKTIKENCLSSFKNQNYPFDMLVKDLDLTRDTSRNPLFDVIFVYQNNGYPKINFKNTKTEYFIPDNKISKFDLTLEIIPVNNEYSLRFEYCTKLFDEDFIKRLSSHYINILNAILGNTEIKIADIDMLSEEEKNQILYEFNDTKVDYPKDKTIIDLFEEQVEKTPNNIAVVFEDQKLTYKELNEKANQLARILISRNVVVGDMVCILLDKSLEMIVSILSILKVGATFLPIDINYPKERIDYIINDSKSNVLLTTQNLISKANDTVQVLNVELDNIQYSQYSKENVNVSYSIDNLAYVMYTSGSTGNPKGVMVTHKNVLRLVKNNQFITFSENEHILQTGSIVFDACTFEIWGALLNGFELYIIKKELLLDTAYLKKYMYDNKITSLFITTQLFNQLVDSDIEIFSSVSNVLTGGEAVSVKHINKLNLHNSSICIIHCYGPTENTTFSTCYDVEKVKYNHTVPIGKPISNSTAYVVSSSGLLCPIGVPGELWVGGDGVAKGYLNNEDLTTEKFIPNPFDNGIVYKTGDLVKWLPDGNIEFIGRIDNQVKVRGFRIELSEIDLKLLEYPDIKYATTILNTINNEKVICSYFVAKSKIDLTKLKEFLKSSLPNYMIPTYMLQLEKFKMNINGKIDKKTLPTDFRSLKRTKTIKKPSNEIEEKLLPIYQSVTNIDEISVTDDLFEDLHGDSLIAMKIQVEALSQNINIAYSDIFKYPSIRLLANHLMNQEKRYQETDTFSLADLNKYDKLLEKNSLEYPIKICNTPITNILLTGFTGFLGAHILDSFIKKETGIVYCLIRSKNNMTAKERLLNVLHFYFEDKYDKFIDNRIQVVEGDISFNHLGLSDRDYLKLGKIISTVIHSAALVKHYGMYKDFENANIIGTKNIVDFAAEFNLNLLHISTLSVSGNNFADGSHVEEPFEHDVNFSENNFYIGQNVSGLYARSKFKAEHIVLDAIYNKGLKATILRMGNLTSRFSEGKFQQNHFENAFVNRFKSFLQIGYVPDYMLGLYAEFTPIDYCGDAIIEIARHFNPEYTVFHLMNEKRVYLDRLFDMMKQLNINLNIVSEKEFIKIINNLLADENKKMYIEGIINDFDKNNKHLIYESKVKVKCDFSKAYLEKLGFSWPYIDINYIRNYFKYLEDIGYLNIHTK